MEFKGFAKKENLLSFSTVGSWSKSENWGRKVKQLPGVGRETFQRHMTSKTASVKLIWLKEHSRQSQEKGFLLIQFSLDKTLHCVFWWQILSSPLVHYLKHMFASLYKKLKNTGVNQAVWGYDQFHNRNFDLNCKVKLEWGMIAFFF